MWGGGGKEGNACVLECLLSKKLIHLWARSYLKNGLPLDILQFFLMNSLVVLFANTSTLWNPNSPIIKIENCSIKQEEGKQADRQACQVIRSIIIKQASLQVGVQGMYRR